MHRFKNSLTGFAVLTALICVALLTTSPTRGQSGEAARDVNVVNIPTTNSRQSGRWAVDIGNTPAVSLAPGGLIGIDPRNNSVQLANTAANPVFVSNVSRSRTPFQVSLGLAFPTAPAFATETFVVPAGKRLVIEYISYSILLPGGQSLVSFTVGTTVGGDFANHHLIRFPEHLDLESVRHFSFSQEVRLYADPSSTVVVRADRSDVGNNGGGTVTFSGYLEDT